MALAATCANASIVTNGSFELGTFNPPAQATMTLTPGSTAITGWQVVNDALAWIGVGDPWGLDAQSGDLFPDVPFSAGAFGGIQQVLMTSPGTEYSVTFYPGAPLSGVASSLISAAGTNATFVSPPQARTMTGTFRRWRSPRPRRPRHSALSARPA
jgi:hypothetical protein